MLPSRYRAQASPIWRRLFRHTVCLAFGIPARANAGREHRRQNCDDRNDDEQLDVGESEGRWECSECRTRSSGPTARPIDISISSISVSIHFTLCGCVGSASRRRRWPIRDRSRVRCCLSRLGFQPPVERQDLAPGVTQLRASLASASSNHRNQRFPKGIIHGSNQGPGACGTCPSGRPPPKCFL